MWLLCRAICQAKCPWSWQGRHNGMRVGAVCRLLAWGVAHPAHAARPEVIIDPGGIGPAVLQAINGAVEAITRLAEDQDGGEVSRLRRRAHDATVSALQTRGYYAPTVTLEVGQDIAGETWELGRASCRERVCQYV